MFNSWNGTNYICVFSVFLLKFISIHNKYFPIVLPIGIIWKLSRRSVGFGLNNIYKIIRESFHGILMGLILARTVPASKMYEPCHKREGFISTTKVRTSSIHGTNSLTLWCLLICSQYKNYIICKYRITRVCIIIG